MTEPHCGLMILRGARRYWGQCICGWLSRTYDAPMGVQIEFGEHLVALAGVKS